MSGRYLLIEFDNEAQAESLRAKISNAKSKTFRVVGLFARPDKTCKCYRSTKDAKTWGLKRGSRMGWWVCPECKRGVLRDHELNNLIKPEEIENPGTFTGVGPSMPSQPSNSTPRPYRYLTPILRITALPFTEKVDKVDPQ